MSKEHSVTVSIISESNGVVNQEVLCKEYASTAEELVWKNFTFSDFVMPAVDAACKHLAEQGGFPVTPPSGGKPKK